jgi:hypothetical protein
MIAGSGISTPVVSSPPPSPPATPEMPKEDKPNYFLYGGIAVAVVVVLIILYFVFLRKPASD